MAESNRIEYKVELTDTFEKEVIAFLNYREGGVIYFGIDKEEKIIGINNVDSAQLKIKDRIKNNIQPSCMGLFDVIHEIKHNKDIIKITVASGSEKPYYLKKQGMSEKGCFIRIGSASEPMPVNMIEELFAKRTRNSIGSMRSPRADLTFAQLKIYYEESGLALNNNFLNNLELLTPEKDYNYAAYLLADSNGIIINIAKYADNTRFNLIENKEYGHCSLIKAVKSVLNKLEIENKTFTQITYHKRLQRKMIDTTALREAVINAIVHNDYSNGGVPKFELFTDRIEITSMGGLPYAFNKEDFFEGLSSPRNKEIMRIFRDIDLVEHLGSGVPRIIQIYDTSVFHISENYLRVIFEYNRPFKDINSINKSSEKVSEKSSEKASEKSAEKASEKSAEKASEKSAEKASEKSSEKAVEEAISNDLEINTEEKVRRKASEKSLEKVSEKTSEKIYILLKNKPQITIEELAKNIGISTRSIERNLRKLQRQNLLKRIGADKGGYWKVINKK